MTTPTATKRGSVRVGADRIVSDCANLIASRSLGILTNHTGQLSNGTHLTDAIMDGGFGRVAALFGPEHGIQGNAPDGTGVGHSKHPRYGIPTFSLYGEVHKPTRDMLSGLDVLVCDIQDVGARFYTYSATVALAMEAAAEMGISVVILDRPNPIRGLFFDGPLRVAPLKSLVGWLPVPITHGLTLGELLSISRAEGWIESKAESFSVVTVENWSRSQWYDETGLPWTAPSPNMPRLSTAVLYPGTCLLEGTTISEGRGTEHPFELIGAPWADATALIARLERQRPAGVRFLAEDFTPKEIPGVAANPKYLGQTCHGIRIVVDDRDRLEPVRLGILLLSAFKRVHRAETELKNRRFDMLAGDPMVRRMLEGDAPPDEIFDSWKAGLDTFGRTRSRHLLYT
jgi:uncharacterized protein YbbC (DUF1343 family)